MDQIKQVILTQAVQAMPLLFAALVGVASAALGAIAKHFNASANGTKISQVGGRVAMLADAVVHDLESSVRPTMAGVVEDGRLTPDEGRVLKTQAVEAMKQSLGQRGLKEIGFVLGLAAEGVGTYLSGQIEAAVNRLRGFPKVQAPPLRTAAMIAALQQSSAK